MASPSTSFPDLVAAKKTQRDKDWPLIRRLVEAHYFEHRTHPIRARVEFWARELRTPELLVEVAENHPRVCRRLAAARSLLACALDRDLTGVARGLLDEEMAERELDRQYWQPLRKELKLLSPSRRKT